MFFHQHSVSTMLFFFVSTSVHAMQRPPGDAYQGYLTAIAENNIPAVEVSLRHNPDFVDQFDRYSQDTAVHAAVKAKGDTTQLITLLLQAAAPYKPCKNSFASSVHAAAKLNNVTALALLQDAGGDLNVQNALGESPCYGAMESDALEAVAWLHTAGANVNSTDLYGGALVHWAVIKGELKKLNHVLAHGGRLDVQTETPALPPSVIRTNLPHEIGLTPFHVAAYNLGPNTQDAKKLLLYHGLWHGHLSPVTHQELFTLLCCLNRLCPALYANRFNLLLPYVVQQVTAQGLVKLLSSPKESGRAFGQKLLRPRAMNVQRILLMQSNTGNTAHMIECQQRVQDTKAPEPMLLPCKIGNDYKQFIDAAKTGTLTKVPLTNVFKAALDVTESPSWSSWEWGKCVIC